MAPLSRVLVAGSVTGPSRLNAAARRGRAGLPYSHPFSVRCGAPATTEPRVGAFANSLSLLPLQSGSESELQAQLDWLSESNQVAVVVSQQGLPRLGFFSEDENAWGHAEVAMWGDLRVQFVTSGNEVVMPADCYKDVYAGPEECIKLAVSDCKTTAELRECFNHTTAELPACCLGRVGNEWVDKYKKPTHPALTHTANTPNRLSSHPTLLAPTRPHTAHRTVLVSEQVPVSSHGYCWLRAQDAGGV